MGSQKKSLFSIICKTIVGIIIFTIGLVLILAILPNHLFPNLPIDPTGYKSVNNPLVFDNWSSFLPQKSEYLLNGLIVGPESFAERDDYLYTGLADGRLVEINKKSNELRDITRFGIKTDCKNNEYWKALECGRPLGLDFHRDHLFVLDSLRGLFAVNVTTGDKKHIDFNNSEIKGLFNSLVFDPELNIVYITVSTTKWSIDRIFYSVLDYEDTGYLFAFNLDSKKSVVLKTGFRLTNGIQITKDKKYVLVSETMTSTIYKISLQTIRKAFEDSKQIKDQNLEIFAKELPGEPDNIRIDESGDVWFGVFSLKTGVKTAADYLSNLPFIRKMIARILYLSSILIDYINTNICSNHALEMLAFDLYTGHFMINFMPKNGAIIKLDSNTGKIKQILSSTQFNGISEAIIDSEGHLYYGSFKNRFIGKIKRGDY